MHPLTRILIDAARSLSIDYDCLDQQRDIYRFRSGTHKLHVVDWALSCNQWLGSGIAASPLLQLNFLEHHGITVIKTRSFDVEPSHQPTGPLLHYCRHRYPVIVTYRDNRYARMNSFFVSNEKELHSIVSAPKRHLPKTYDIFDIPSSKAYSALVCQDEVIDIVELSHLPAKRIQNTELRKHIAAEVADFGLSTRIVKTVTGLVTPDSLPRVALTILTEAAATLSLGFTSVDFHIENPGSDTPGILVSDLYEAPQLYRHCYLDGQQRLDPARQFFRIYFELTT